jgi:hypothetical protein
MSAVEKAWNQFYRAMKRLRAAEVWMETVKRRLWAAQAKAKKNAVKQLKEG